uniref:protein-tyrosine-phosphatase n=1 Tax=Ciona savignyi TaxID=51511 RepID=H2YZU5_CIOSA
MVFCSLNILLQTLLFHLMTSTANPRSSTVAPVITNAPESQTGVAKGTLALICNATGNPRPRIDWRKDNKEISKNRYRIVPYVFESGSGSVLWIAPARKKKDKARYTCVASNRLGDVSESADVHFYDEEATPSGFPHIDINPTVKTVERSRAVSMECGISGSPTPSIRWFRNYQPLYLNGTRIRMDPITVNKTTFPGSLIISTSNDTDNGKYHCSGTNVHGTVFSKGTSIYVKERIVYPRFSIPPRKSYDVKINDPFNLTCVAVGSPMPVVKWQKQTSGGLVDVWPLKGMPPIVGMNVYHMQRVTESANYTCVAKSRISTITTTTEVTVKSVPKAPTNVHQYSDATSTTLSVAWDSGDLPPATVTGYTVFYRVMGSTTPYQYIDQISSESFTITGLQPYTEYDVVLMASNAQGQGNTTQPVYLRTAEAAPRSAPREVGAYLYQTNTIMVTWLEPQHPNGVISSYNVYYTSNPSLPVSEWMDVPVRNDRRLTALRRLVPHVTYSIRVSATNGAGESPYSDIAVVKTTHGVPPQPRNFHGEAASTTSIHLTWDRPNWGGASSFDITSYMVFYNCSSPSCSSQITFEPVKEFTLGRLRPNTRYDIRLAAQTVHGVGAETSMISVSTLSDVPSAPPEHLVVSPIDATSIRVTWEPPAKESRNGELTHYTVYYRQHGLESAAADMQVNGTSVVVQGLQPYTEYDVWLTASTTVGEGPRANAVVTTSQSTPAAPPSDVDLQALNSSAVRVRWSPLPTHHRNGDIRGYQIAYAISDVITGRTLFRTVYNEGRRENILVTYNPTQPPQESTITKLRPKTRYSVSVSAFTVRGAGPASPPKYVTTLGEVPNAPRLEARRADNGKAQLRWSSPVLPKGRITGYALRYRCQEEGANAMCPWKTRLFDHNVEQFTPEDVIPGWTYQFFLSASNSDGPGVEASAQINLPPIAPSDAPANLSATTVLDVPGKDGSSPPTPYALNITWSPLTRTQSNGRILEYALYWSPSTIGSSQPERLLTNRTYYWFINVLPNQKYEFNVAAVNSAGEGDRSPGLIVTVTPPLHPTDPRRKSNITISDLGLAEVSTTTVWLRWLPPSGIDVDSYKVSVNANVLQQETEIPEVGVRNLRPNTAYNFTLTTQHTGGDTDGWPSWLVARTSPQLLHTQPYVLNISEHGTVQVVLSRATNFATVKRYSVVVVPVNKKDVRHPSTLNHEVLVSNSISMKKRRRRRQTNGEMPYITAEFDAIDIEQIFVVGDAINYGGYINQVLVRGLSYKVFLRAMLKTPVSIFFIPSSRQSSLNPDPTDPTLLESSSDQLWILGPILAAIVILLIVFIILYTRRKKSKSGNQVKYMKPVSKHVTHEPHIQHDPVKMRRQNCKTPGMPSHPPISIHTFQHHVEQLRANDNLKFSQEYESIDPGQQFTWAQSTLEVNKPKNRYANVISYDHSRLTLSPIDGVPGSDYINANYISGFRRQNAYIATQGPMRETVSDFWRMVWEQRSSIICMMTKCEERCKVKCEQYWPSGGSETYGLISVTLIDELELATYCVRTFNVVKSGLSDRREIKHFQFTAWPDHGVPEHPTPVLNFMRRVKSHHQPDAGPIVVHCSAGVGRAGCFICIDAMLERIKYEETVDVYGQVTCMRAERNYMVQTEDQYIFIHDALLEAINSGNTELPAKDLFNHLHKLTTPDPDHPITGMELEFKRLASNKASASRFVSANLPCNKFKNRLVNILPYEGTRVCLQPIRGVEGSDYINASFIDGYRQKRAYIATQGPLPETTDDFWRTLWEHNSTIVVMLTKLREQGRDKCHQYWPAERSARYQYFVVDPMSEYSMQQYMLREFKVTDARDGQSRTVRQFQFTDWPEQAVPKSGEGFIDFIGQVHKTKEQFGQEGPITIHCSGVGRTGVFITLSLALERMRFENLVDMFQTVKMLRTQRPAMVQTEDQYQFCYRAALEYLGSFDHYAM